MAARRLAGPAAASSRGADARPTRGRIREWGHPIPSPPHGSAASGASSPEHTPGPAQGLPPRWGLAAAKGGVLGSQRLGWPKVTAKATGELQLLSALAGVPRLRHCSAVAAPAMSQCSREDTSPLSQRACSSTQTPPTSPTMANYGLIPLQQHIPPPPCTVHPGGSRVKAQIPSAALM